jgi:aquaporin Z
MATKKAVSKSSTSTAKKPTTVKKVSKTTVKKTTVKAVASRNASSVFSLASVKNAPFIAALVGEFIGTFLLATAVITGQGQPIIVLFALAGIVLLVGALSGAHLNPAITVGAWVTRRISGLKALGYVVAQIFGAIAAFALLSAFVGGAAAPEATQYGAQSAPALFQATALPEGKEWYIFFAELVGALILGFAVSNALREKKDRVAAAFTVGLGIFVGLLLAASAAAFVGGSAIINPAVAGALEAFKTVVPTVAGASWHFWPIFVYVIAPAIGAIIGFFVQDILRTASKNDEE